MPSIDKNIYRCMIQLGELNKIEQSTNKEYFRVLCYRNYATLFKRLENILYDKLSEEQIDWINTIAVAECDEDKLKSLYDISDTVCMIHFISLIIYLVGGIDLPQYIIDEYINVTRKLLQDII